MSVTVLRPNATLGNSATLTGGATAHAVLSDDDDASYANYDTGNKLSQLSLGTFSLPAGAVARRAAIRLRQNYYTTAVTWRAQLYDPTRLNAEGTGLLVYLSAPMPSAYLKMTVTSVSVHRAFTQAEIDGLSLVIDRDQGSGAGNVYEAYVDLYYVEQPVVTVTAPTGTITDTNRPAVTWANTLDSEGGPQTHYEVKVFSAAQYGAGGFDPDTSAVTEASGIVASAVTGRQVAIILPDGTYRAYVRTAQTVNGEQHWSAWDYEAFTIDVLLPAVPEIVLTAQNAAGRIQIDMAPQSGDATTDAMEVQRSVDGGETWAAVRNIHGDDGVLFSTTTATTFDYEAPNGVEAEYRARALHEYSGLYAASAWSAVSATTWGSADWWLKHVNLPALNVPMELVAYGDISRAARSGSFQPLGAARPIVISDTRGSATGSSTVRTRTTATRNALEAIAALPATLLLQGPAVAGEPDRFIRIGDLSVARVVENVHFSLRTFTIPWTEVDSPGGAQTGAQYVAPADGEEEELIVI